MAIPLLLRRMQGTAFDGDPYWANVTLLLEADGADGSTSIIDSSSTGHTITPQGNAQISTARSKFGASSIRLDGTGDALTSGYTSAFAFGSGNFTVEGWYWIDTNSSNPYLFSTNTAANNYRAAIQATSAGKLDIFTATTAGAIFGTAGAIPTGEWVHIAVTQVSGVTKGFINGTKVIDATPVYPWPSSNQRLEIGAAFFANTAYLQGNLEQLRVTKGVARYAADFTVPTSAFPSR